MARQRVLVLGCGMIGSAAAVDLARSPEWVVTVADRDAEALARVADRCGARTIVADASERGEVARLAADCDLVVVAVPGRFGHQVLEAALDAGRHAVSISFTPEDSRALNDLARSRGVTAIVDCGVAPGLSNMMVGHGAAMLSSCERVDIFVGGVPVDRRSPFEFKAAFAPDDVIAEYVDSARVVENGTVVVKEALSEVELVDVPGVGTLEAFLTDGLGSLIDTIGAPFMQEKTLRYPGHAAAMRALRESGLFATDPVRVDGHELRPRDLVATVLFPQWKYRDDEADLTILRVVVSGRRGDARERLTWNLVDRYDPATGLRSMARTTAFTATITAGLIAQGAIPAGVHPPEIVGRLGLLNGVLRELDARGVHCELVVGR